MDLSKDFVKEGRNENVLKEVTSWGEENVYITGFYVDWVNDSGKGKRVKRFEDYGINKSQGSTPVGEKYKKE